MDDLKSYAWKGKFINIYTRGLFFIIGDTLSILVTANVAHIILSPFAPPERSFPIEQAAIITGSVLMGLAVFRMYIASWKYVSLRDLIRIILGILVGGALYFIISQSYMVMDKYHAVFTTLVLLGAILTVGGFRISKRLYSGVIKSPPKTSKHTIIFGAESEGEQILRDIIINHSREVAVYGMFDDRSMPGLMLHGVKILGDNRTMIEYIRRYPVDLLIVAIPDYPKRKLRAITDEIKTIRPDLDIKVLPSFHSLTDDLVGVRHIRDISIEDILGREPVNIDMSSIKNSITGKTVLVTGAGGSIGSELVRQCSNLKPGKLIALDIDETELFHLEHEFKEKEFNIIPSVASVTDKVKIDSIFEQYKPNIIFHAAAYKHVPMMELFPSEAVKVNIGGTRVLSSLACKHQVEKFILISTDKAVNPTNVMGATKRVAEELCLAYTLSNTADTKFIAVRFGNVLGSRGSVVPLFIEQIKNGGPVTITDPEMKRYFMTIPEAVLLVMQAGAMGEGGEVFVLDMGEPVKIIDMAKDLIRLHGLKPYRDIQIKITGRRPGEKLFEELLNAEEGVIETEHKEIFKALGSRKLTTELLHTTIAQLFDHLRGKNDAPVRDLLKKIVPTYSYKTKQELEVKRSDKEVKPLGRMINESLSQNQSAGIQQERG